MEMNDFNFDQVVSLVHPVKYTHILYTILNRTLVETINFSKLNYEAGLVVITALA